MPGFGLNKERCYLFVKFQGDYSNCNFGTAGRVFLILVLLDTSCSPVSAAPPSPPPIITTARFPDTSRLFVARFESLDRWHLRKSNPTLLFLSIKLVRRLVCLCLLPYEIWQHHICLFSLGSVSTLHCTSPTGCCLGNSPSFPRSPKNLTLAVPPLSMPPLAGCNSAVTD